mgnify:CR=1 FL=1
MKKILIITIIGIFFLNAIAASGINNKKDMDYNLIVENQKITFSKINIVDVDNNFLEIKLKDTATYLLEPGYPMIPKITKIIQLPFQTKNIDIHISTNNIEQHEIQKQVIPAPPHIPLTEVNKPIKTIGKNQQIYASSEPYPNSWYNYQIKKGINSQNQRVTYIFLNIFPVRYTPALNILTTTDEVNIKITYEKQNNNLEPTQEEYDMVIIAPKIFSKELEKLVTHKTEMGLKTYIKTTEEIYEQYTGVDKPEQIKYFIKDAIETNNIKYVLLVGGLKSIILGKSRDNANEGTKGWYLPVRYNNLYDNPEHPLEAGTLHDPGVISDLYYADIYDGEGNFSSWDTNNDGIFAAWGMENVENDTAIDLVPDISLGRLACTGKTEVRNVVNKIINYEKEAADPSWFKKMIVFSGDGFMDQEDLNFEWDTNGLPDGKYVIKAQSKNHDNIAGPVEEIHITLDKTKETVLTFNHDDNLRINTYPGYPIAEIVSVSEGNILGNTDFVNNSISEKDAYGNEFYGWANLNYTNGVLHIRGKTYDPKPYGNVTDIHVWVENSDGVIVYSDWRNNSEMYYEGEWITGEKLLEGGGGALYYLPEDFEKVIIWASNGKLRNQKDVINELSQGSGFAFLSGHGSPNVWADHFPGIPGNRKYGSFTGLQVIGIKPYFRFVSFPIFPMNKIKNTDKLPVTLIGGCHNSQFNVSMIPALLDPFNKRSMWTHGTPVPECFSWYLVKMPRTGAIATIGNTGLGYGTLGKYCNIGGLDGGICIEFFKQYAKQYNDHGYGILGDTYTQTLVTYTSDFDMENMDHAKTLSQWVLLGDPSLRIGGYS